VTGEAAAAVGNAGALNWKNKYLTDEWGGIQYDETTLPEEKDARGDVVFPERVEIRPVPNPDWDDEKTYTPHTESQEWAAVKLLGQAILRRRDLRARFLLQAG
jgi:hypothetical protein